MISTTISGSERNSQMYPHARLLNSQEEESRQRQQAANHHAQRGADQGQQQGLPDTFEDHRVKEPAGKHRPLPARVKGHGLDHNGQDKQRHHGADGRSG
jgi:hypothetical protein